MTSDNNKAHRAPLRVKIVACLIVIAFALFALEAIARITFLSKENLSSFVKGFLTPIELRLDPYEQKVHDEEAHWRLRPNYKASINEIIADKKDADKWLGAKAIEKIKDANESTSGLRINAHGFKGPEINEAHACPRVLAIGDSVTFGLGSLSYPFFMRQYFAKNQINVEVVNAGVEGYAPRNALLEVERYKALKPDVVIFYIGWNALYAMGYGEIAANRFSKIPWMLHRTQYVLERLFEDSNSAATEAYRRTLLPDKSDPDIEFWTNRHLGFMADIEKLVSNLQTEGAEIYLVSLFGLFHEDIKPSPQALAMGHLPIETNNPYVLAAMTTSYNRQLRKLANAKDVKFIDLHGWGRRHMRPLENFFFDSVHFNEAGLRAVGDYLAAKIASSKALFKQSCVQK